MLAEGADWRSTVGSRATSPHKHDDVKLFGVPGLKTDLIMPDSLHNFHLGWGQGQAYESFIEYCTVEGRTTGCDKFSKLSFDMKLRG